MSLGEDVQANLPFFREQAESKMISECVIDSGEFTGGVWNEEILDYTPKVPLPSYEGICEWKAAGTAPRSVDAAGQILLIQAPTLKLPVEGSENVRPGQTGRITSNPNDRSLEGTEFIIDGNHSQTYSTARRLPVKVS